MRNNIRDELLLALSFFRGDSRLHCDCGACATLLDLLLSFHLLCAATARIASAARVRANLIGVAVSFIFSVAAACIVIAVRRLPYLSQCAL